MDFGALPPEINSGRMYTGPGSGSMLAAAAAWDGLAGQLRSTAASYSSAISGLTADWQGPSSVAMAAAAAPYAAWMSATAAQAEQTAAQARAAAAAYETAFAATVPPPVITANRAALASLLATNIFGQNTAAIATTEAQYAGMWAQDAAAMYGYAGQSAVASHVTPFTPPPQTTDPEGLAAQSATVAQPMSAVTSVLQSLASPTAADPPSLQTLLTSLLPLLIGADLFEVTGPASLPARNALIANTFGFGLAARGFQTGELPVPLVPGVLYPPVADLSAAASAASTVTASVGRAGLVGPLSVPPSWAAATPVVRLAASVLQGTGPAATATSRDSRPGERFWSDGTVGSGRQCAREYRSPRRDGNWCPSRRPQHRRRQQGQQDVGQTQARPRGTIAETGIGAALAHRQSTSRGSSGAAVEETGRPRGARVFTRQTECRTKPAAVGLIAIPNLTNR